MPTPRTRCDWCGKPVPLYRMQWDLRAMAYGILHLRTYCKRKRCLRERHAFAQIEQIYDDA